MADEIVYPEQVNVSWAEAPARIMALSHAAAGPQGAAIVAISGPVGSGKSTLARAISTCIVSTDDYLPDYESLAVELRDRPEHADLPTLAEHLQRLRRGEPVQAPVWSFQTHRRESWREIQPGTIIVCEGIHALHGPAATVADVRVFVEAPPHVRWQRWERLELSGERGWGVAAAREYFDRVAEPTFAAYAASYRRAAHVIVRNDGDDGAAERA